MNLQMYPTIELYYKSPLTENSLKEAQIIMKNIFFSFIVFFISISTIFDGVLNAQSVDNFDTNKPHVGLTSLLYGTGFGGIVLSTAGVDVTGVLTTIRIDASNKYSTIGILVDLKQKIDFVKNANFIFGASAFLTDGQLSGSNFTTSAFPIFIGIQKTDGPLAYTARLGIVTPGSVGTEVKTSNPYMVLGPVMLSATYLF